MKCYNHDWLITIKGHKEVPPLLESLFNTVMLSRVRSCGLSENITIPWRLLQPASVMLTFQVVEHRACCQWWNETLYITLAKSRRFFSMLWWMICHGSWWGNTESTEVGSNPLTKHGALVILSCSYWVPLSGLQRDTEDNNRNVA